MAKDATKAYLFKPFRVIHQPTGSVGAGFNTLEDAQADAVVRNERAKKLGLDCTYEACPKPA